MGIAERLRSLFERRKPEPDAPEGVRANRAQRRAAGFVRRGPAYKQTVPPVTRYFRRHAQAITIAAERRTRRQRKQVARAYRAFHRRYGR